VTSTPGISDDGTADLDAGAIRAALIKGGATWKSARRSAEDQPSALVDTDFSDADLAGRDLADLDFSRSDFFAVNFHHTNLKKSVFRDADLTNANLTGAALYKADFNGAILQEVTLTGADLTSASCRSADFRGADLAGAKFCDADLRGADFSNCDLTGADFSRADITGAKFHFARMTDANVTHLIYGGYRKMAGLYYGVRDVEATYGNAIFVRDAKDQDYIDTIYQTHLDKPPGPGRDLSLMLFRAWGLIDHGRSLAKVGFYAFIIATLYGLIYLMDMTYDWQIMDYSNSAKTWFTPFYYSVVTYTTLGFGDVTADSLFGEIFVISEVILGYFTLGLLLAILANTIARRS